MIVHNLVMSFGHRSAAISNGREHYRIYTEYLPRGKVYVGSRSVVVLATCYASDQIVQRLMRRGGGGRTTDARGRPPEAARRKVSFFLKGSANPLYTPLHPPLS